MPEVDDHAFNAAISAIHGEAKAVSDQRAQEYGDTWSLANIRGGLLAATLSLPQPEELRLEFIRLVRCAVMVDIKDSRLLGPWKRDTLLDGLNYAACYLAWRDEYEARLSHQKTGAQPRRSGDVIELSEEGSRILAEMMEKPPQPGAARRRIEKMEAELVKIRERREVRELPSEEIEVGLIPIPDRLRNWLFRAFGD